MILQITALITMVWLFAIGLYVGQAMLKPAPVRKD